LDCLRFGLRTFFEPRWSLCISAAPYGVLVIVALCGGVGAARFLSGLVQIVDSKEIVAIVNTGDDLVLHGLHISPDIDTVNYTVGGLDNKETGWGITGESWRVMEELGTLGGKDWFRLGDRDLATHLYRTERLFEGASLSLVTKELAERRGVGVSIIPMSDDPVRTILVRETGQEISFQEYFVKLHHDVAVKAVRFDGASDAKSAPGVLEAIEKADRIIVCPSNPIVSIDPILSVPGIKNALTSRRKDIVGISPIIEGRALKGPADRLLQELGHESSAFGVAKIYSPWVATLVIDSADKDLQDKVEATGMRCIVTDTIMSTGKQAKVLAQVVLDAPA
jgi:LPPG:FO 2-phospho-L-lactate transferase